MEQRNLIQRLIDFFTPEPEAAVSFNAIKADAYEEGFWDAHREHYREDKKRARFTPKINCTNPYKESNS